MPKELQLPEWVRNVEQHILAGFTGIWLRTDEPDFAWRGLVQLARSWEWQSPLHVWDADQGLREMDHDKDELKAASTTGSGDGASNKILPAGFLDRMRAKSPFQVHNGTKKIVRPQLWVAHNLQRFLLDSQAGLLQQMENILLTCGSENKVLIVLSPTDKIRPDLSRLFGMIEHPLPDAPAREGIFQGLVQGAKTALGTDIQKTQSVEACAGLTHLETQNCASLSLVRRKLIVPDELWGYKADSLRKTGILQAYRGKESLDEICGLGALKNFCLQSLTAKVESTSNSLARLAPRGVFMAGCPGTGKSMFSKALGNSVGRPTILLDVGGLMGSHVGETEQNLRQALSVIDAMAPCILQID